MSDCYGAPATNYGMEERVECRHQFFIEKEPAFNTVNKFTNRSQGCSNSSAILPIVFCAFLSSHSVKPNDISIWMHSAHTAKTKCRKYKYSQKRNMGTSVPISTFMCLWANYIFPRWVCLFCWRKYVDWSWEYMYKSLKDTWMWNCGWGRAIPRKGIYI